MSLLPSDFQFFVLVPPSPEDAQKVVLLFFLYFVRSGGPCLLVFLPGTDTRRVLRGLRIRLFQRGRLLLAVLVVVLIAHGISRLTAALPSAAR
ncbi:hypothetical protein D5S18_00825 [Nocardia panacis]|uniref:Uncharacterized protein n=1 Tax=Nocardia panacis TaxID=2340916 RepID=A0A3A4KWP2_9NOCA|nr:hypothetical protein D5S18_00825 [Nocardia panacis]